MNEIFSSFQFGVESSSVITMVDCKISTRGNGEKPRKLMKFMKTLVTYSAAVLFGLFSIRAVSYFNLNQEFSELAQSVKCPEPPKYWGVCLWEWNKKGNLRTMNRVFDRLGYVTVNATEGDDWDVLWSIEYPYEPRKSEIFDPLKVPLKKHQRINHFPGFGNITSKAIMTTRNRNIKYILPGFQFPQMIKEFQTYVAANPNAKFVEKNLGNRGIKLVERHEIKFTKTSKFYQRFMEKPFLVDERFMDFGIYVVVSSINPLRIYRFDQEVHLRFCPQPYYPFDKNILDKYVISDNRQDFMQLPETKSYFDNYGYSFKLSMEHYFRKKGHNVTELWRKIDEAIVQLVLNNEKNLMAEVCVLIMNFIFYCFILFHFQTSRWFNSTHHFFELFRFDFLLNELLEPHITEVNMSPAVMPNSDVAERIAQTYEQLIHDTLKLLGAGSKLDLMAW